MAKWATSYLVALLLVIPVAAGAQLSYPLVDGVVQVQSLMLHPEQQRDGVVRGEVKLLNIAGKEISAFHLQFVVTYADGEKRTVVTGGADLIPVIIKVKNHPEKRGQPGTATFQAGESYTASFSLSANAHGALPVSAEAQVFAVIFEDGTARGDAPRIRSILNLRRSFGEMYSALIADLRAAFDSSAPMRLLQERRSEIEGREGHSARAQLLNESAGFIRSESGRLSERDAISLLIEQYGEYAAGFARYSTLRFP